MNTSPARPAYFRVVYLDGLVTVCVAGARWLEQVSTVDVVEAEFTLQPLDGDRQPLGEPRPSKLYYGLGSKAAVVADG